MRIKEKGERTIIKYFFSIRFLWGRAGGAEVATRYLFIVLRKKERNPFGTLPSAVAAPQKVFFLHMLLFFPFRFQNTHTKAATGFSEREKRWNSKSFFSWGDCDAFYNLKLGERGGGELRANRGRETPSSPPNPVYRKLEQNISCTGEDEEKRVFSRYISDEACGSYH